MLLHDGFSRRRTPAKGALGFTGLSVQVFCALATHPTQVAGDGLAIGIAPGGKCLTDVNKLAALLVSQLGKVHFDLTH
jgi:hypothetical protein